MSPDTAFQPAPQATLSWDVRNADSVTLADVGDGPSIDVEAAGSTVVSPSATTTYVLTASNAAGEVSETVTLTVNPFGVLSVRRLDSGTVRPLSAVHVGESVDVIFSLLIVPPSSVEVADVHASVDGVRVTQLHDDGAPANGDDILGDGVFSGRAAVSFSTVGTSLITVDMTIGTETLSTDAVVTVVKAPTGHEIEDVASATEAVEGHLTSLGSLTGVDAVMDATEAFVLENLEVLGVASYEVFPRQILLHHASGVSSLLMFFDERDSIAAPSGTSALHEGPLEDGGGLAEGPERASTPARVAASTVPPEAQTRGQRDESSPLAFEVSQGTVIGPADTEVPRTVLLWMPYESEGERLLFGACAKTDPILAALGESELGFDVTVLKDEAATVDSLRKLADYGYVVFDTHGSMGVTLQTGEPASDSTPHMADALAGTMFPCTGMVWTEDGSTLAQGTKWCLTPQWFSDNVPGPLPDSIIFNGSCESTTTDGFWDVFKTLGAKTYLGYSESATCLFIRNSVVDFTRSLASGSTSGQSYSPRTEFVLVGAEWELRGSAFQRFASGLFNPHFHQGLAGWKVVGDGRAVTRLGLEPHVQLPRSGNQMAIISSGLGFTTARGSIEQTFRVPVGATRLSFSWNFLSEEFLEFIGSPYQDRFAVSVIGLDGSETVLLEMAIDETAAAFGAGHCASSEDACTAERGELMPGWDIGTGAQFIRFDVGDVWYTGWQESPDFDISPFAGQVVTLRFFATDVTDEIFDTAVLIDRIWIE